MSPIALDLREEPFAVAGGAIEDLRRALAILGPLRGGVRYAAFTDWEVSFQVRAGAPPHDGALVQVRATVHLPAWRPPRSVDRALVARWERYAAALRRHEMGHVALAKAAGEAVLASLAELPPGAPSALVMRAAALAVERIRAAERAYDVETRHGAAQGAALLSSETATIRPPLSMPAGTEDA